MGVCVGVPSAVSGCQVSEETPSPEPAPDLRNSCSFFSLFLLFSPKNGFHMKLHSYG